MACLYGSFLGIKEISAIQANQSSQGARVCVSPELNKDKNICIIHVGYNYS